MTKETFNPILARHSVRQFFSDPVSPAIQDQLAAAFQAAPCGMHYTDVIQGAIISDPALRQQVEQASNNACYNAPLLFVIAGKKDSPFGERDASATAENIMVEAARHSLGSVYVMSGALALNSQPDFLRKIGFDEGYEALVIVAIGKPASYSKAPDRSKRYKLIRK